MMAGLLEDARVHIATGITRGKASWCLMAPTGAIAGKNLGNES